jgi:hypothetical protein
MANCGHDRGIELVNLGLIGEAKRCRHAAVGKEIRCWVMGVLGFKWDTFGPKPISAIEHRNCQLPLCSFGGNFLK